jgi:hypothetical protein
MVAPSGSGKSTIVANLLTNPNFYGPQKVGKKKQNSYFDVVFLFSPTGHLDGTYEDVIGENKIIDSQHVYTELNPLKLQSIFDIQRDIIEDEGIDKSPRILLIIDDCAGTRFTESPQFYKLFMSSRHWNISLFVCIQNYKSSIPRRCRLNCSHVFILGCTNSEKRIICEEFCPNDTDKKKFEDVICHSTQGYDFLFINGDATRSERYRRNLDKIITF